MKVEQMGIAAKCIYPGPHSSLSDEHYLPAALGSFQGCELLKDRVCSTCNRIIGERVETQFLRGGPIAFFRWLLGIEGRDGLPPSPFYRGAAGAPPLIMHGRAPGFAYDLLWEVEPGTRDVFPLRQVLFEHPLVGIHSIPIFDRMRDHPELLSACLRERGLQSAKPVLVYATPEEVPWVESLLRALNVEPPREWVTTGFPSGQITLKVDVGVTEAHFRAVAKIVFHYALKMFPDLSGLEREFEPVRRYIWAGDGNHKFVRQRPDQFVAQFNRGQRPTHWMHILDVARSRSGVVGHAQFFVGPRHMPLPYQVWIGPDPSMLIRPLERFAHQFVILSVAPEGGIVGKMEDFMPARYIIPPT